MRNRGVIVAVAVACLSCFSTGRYDRAHTQRVSTINARYDAALAREHEHYASLVAELQRRRASLVPVTPADPSLLAEIDQQVATLAQRHARTQSRIEQQRQRELAASQQLRAQEIETRRARVRAAADAFATETQGHPSLTPARAARSTAGRAADGKRPADCAPASSCPAPAPASSTCDPGPTEIVSQATGPSGSGRLEPSTPIDCLDDRDCPGGMSCDASAGICCTAVVR